MTTNVATMIDTIRKVAQSPDTVTEDLSEYIGERVNARLQVTKEERKADHWVSDYEGNGR